MGCRCPVMTGMGVIPAGAPAAVPAVETGDDGIATDLLRNCPHSRPGTRRPASEAAALRRNTAGPGAQQRTGPGPSSSGDRI
ncbi:hypothetical protein GCM10023235_05890 [Kitasatospora terrestris]|uniref:Uncharacterized protein n=1 Tax=Kitasatospora terrestris TaxID=258051 RepID=A0ABP9D839_9ACTN